MGTRNGNKKCPTFKFIIIQIEPIRISVNKFPYTKWVKYLPTYFCIKFLFIHSNDIVMSFIADSELDLFYLISDFVVEVIVLLPYNESFQEY